MDDLDLGIIVAIACGVIVVMLIIAAFYHMHEKDDYHPTQNKQPWQYHDYDEDDDGYTYRGSNVHPSKVVENLKREAGEEGEYSVSVMLYDIVQRYGGYIFNGQCFKTDRECHDTFEIDHILICPGGIYIVETKTFKGTVYGKDEDDMWEFFSEYGHQEHFRSNPVKQNEKHLNKLIKILKHDYPTYIYNFVIFVGSDISRVSSNCTYDLESAEELIRADCGDSVYTKEDMDHFKQAFDDVISQYGITHEQHMENIRRIKERA